MYACHAEQKLKCPYDSKNKHLQRVWCKRDANDQDCCTGYFFAPGDRELDGGRLSVKDDGQVFTVTVKSLSQGDGVYWCGLRNGSDTIITLAEFEVYSESGPIQDGAPFGTVSVPCRITGFYVSEGSSGLQMIMKYMNIHKLL